MGRSRKQKQSFYKDIFLIIFSLVIIVASINVIKNVIMGMSNVKLDTNVQFGQVETETTLLPVKEAIFITDSSGIKYKKIDGTFAKDEYLDINNDLYKFDEQGFAYTGIVTESGQDLTFDNGKLVKIAISTNAEKNSKYFSPSYSEQYVVFLNKDEQIENYYPIQYQSLDLSNSNVTAYYLGTEEKKQYASENFLQIDSNYIYFLCKGSNKSFCGKVNRMRMNSSIKETFGNNVEGFVAKFGSVWLYENNKITKATRGNREGIVKNLELEKLDDKTNSSIIHIPGFETVEDFSNKNVAPSPYITPKANDTANPLSRNNKGAGPG